MNKLKINIWLNIVIISISILTIVTGVYSIFSAKLTITGSIGYVAPPPEVQAFCAISGATNGTSIGTTSKPLYATNNTTSTTKARVTMDDEGNVTFGNLNFASSSNTITFNINITNDSSETIAVDIDFESLNLTGITRTVSTDYLQIIRPSSYTGTIADNDASIISSETENVFTFTFTKISGSTPSISGKFKINIQPAKQISTSDYTDSSTSSTCNITKVPACDETTNPTKTITIPSYFYDSDSGRYIKATALYGDRNNASMSNIGTYTNVIVDNGIKSTNKGVFMFSSNIATITLPSSLEAINGWDFYGCTGLTSITIPSSVTSMGALAFESCSNLTSIIVEDGNTVYDSRDNCNAIIDTSTNTLLHGCKNTTIPSSVTSIGKAAFFYCSSLTSITIPSSVTSIGNNAFTNCSSLTSITIPSSVTSIHDSAFSNTTFLTNLKSESEGIYTCSDGKKIMIEASSIGITSAPDLTGVYLIANSAYQSCSNLTSITIPSSVTSIGESAFYFCSSLTSVTFGENSQLTSIGSSAFRDCSKLTSITIPSSVTRIGESAFFYCSSLTRATFEVIEGWKAGSTSLDGTISSTDLAANAKLLTSTYKSYTWTRS